MLLIDPSSVLDDVSSEESVILSLGQAQPQRLTCSLLFKVAVRTLKKDGNIPTDKSIMTVDSDRLTKTHNHRYTHCTLTYRDREEEAGVAGGGTSWRTS